VSPADRATQRVALMRYAGQGFELAIPCPGLAGLESAFAEAHRALYGFDLPRIPIEIVTLRLEAAGRMPAPAPMPPPAIGSVAAATIGRQRIALPDGAAEAPILERAKLPAGASLRGPAIIVQLDATTLVAPGWTARVDPSGALILEMTT
jgi:N-methylhydantoinase A